MFSNMVWFKVTDPGTKTIIVATGVESFALLGLLPWLGLLCLLLMFYLGVLGRMFLSFLLATLSAVSMSQILGIQSIPSALVGKFEVKTGLRQTLVFIAKNTQEESARYAGLALLLMLWLTAIASMFLSRKFPLRRVASSRGSSKSKPEGSADLWEKQNE